MAKKFLIAVPNDGDGIELFPMKEWLRQHQDSIPPGLHPTDSTSHQLRNGLKKAGWSVQETENEVRLIKPGSGELAEFAVPDDAGGSDSDDESSSGQAFGLEYQLRDFIAENIEAISVGGNNVRLYVDPAGRDGIEYSTDIGFIDILAVDDHGAFYVFELKRHNGSDRVIGQLARYMGWVKSTIGRGKDVKGVIVARDIDPKLRYAASIIPDVSLFEYSVEFRLSSADELK